MKMKEVEIVKGGLKLSGLLAVPEKATGIVLFAHGSGSGRLSSRNQFVARTLIEGGIAILLLDLLTPAEEAIDEMTRELRFDIPLLAQRLMMASDWVKEQPETKTLKIGYFGASTGAAAALIAAAKRKDVAAVVSRGGRPDLAQTALSQVKSPTLLIVGGADFGVIELNEAAFNQLNCIKKLEIVPHATHLFEERGALESVSKHALQWFLSYVK
ncbi:MAG TPA: alpha/beta family hydrolase [Chlamydiales bacterium]|nr:alpha/beta family hydrolase [Chlamydiales bacterium]